MDEPAVLIAKHPQVLSISPEMLQAKHAFITGVWGRDMSEISEFPQVLTYSLHYLRARAGFLRLKGVEGKDLHRLLRYPDTLFAKQLAKSDVVEYQAFALAVRHGGGQEAYNAHDYKARVPGGGGEPHDWGSMPLDEMIEKIGPASLKSRGVFHPELTSVDKHMASHTEMLAKDKQLEDELLHMRRTVQAFIAEESLGEAEVTPVTPPTESGSEGAGASGEGDVGDQSK